MARTIRPTRASIRAVAACLAFLLILAPALSAERLSDKDIKQLLERIHNERDRFEDQLDGKLKRSIISGPGGEVNVEKYLDDLQDNVNKVRERFTSQYAASAEVTTVLRQASQIQAYMATLPVNYDGASEWNRLAASMAVLAANYGVTLPLPEGQQARRLNDGEVRKTLEEVAKSVDGFKKELDSSLKKDKAIDKATREASLAEIEGLKERCPEARVARGRRQTGVGRGPGAAAARHERAGVHVRASAVAGRADPLGIGRERSG